MKDKFLVVVPCIIVVVLSLFTMYFNSQVEVELASNVVTVITSDRFMTLQNDGGTHYDTKYEVDLNKKKVTYYESYYKGFEGLQYKDRKLYDKSLNAEEIEKFKKLILDIEENQDIYSIDYDHTYMYYVVEYDDMEIKIYDKDVISRLEEITGRKYA